MSHQTSILADLEADVIPIGTLAYIGQRAKNAHYHYVMSKFREAKMTQARLARRVGKSPAQMNRTLASPGNWTFETYAALIAGICGEEVAPSSQKFAGRARRNGSEREFIGSDEREDELPSPLPKSRAEPRPDTSIIQFKTFEKSLEIAL